MIRFIIISAIICIVIVRIYAEIFRIKYKRDGYKRVNKVSFIEDLKAYITLCIPIINIIIAFIILFTRYEIILDAYLKDGILVKTNTP